MSSTITSHNDNGEYRFDAKYFGYQPPQKLLGKLESIESQLFTAFHNCCTPSSSRYSDNTDDGESTHTPRINLGKLHTALIVAKQLVPEHQATLDKAKWALILDQQRHCKGDMDNHVIDKHADDIRKHEVNQERLKQLLTNGQNLYAKKESETKELQQRINQEFSDQEEETEETSEAEPGASQRASTDASEADGMSREAPESSQTGHAENDDDDDDQGVQELSHQKRVSSSLQRTRALMSQEMERMSSLANVLDETGEYLSGTVEEHSAFSSDTTESQQVLRRLRRENMIDKAVIGFGLTIFLLTVIYIWFKRFSWIYAWILLLWDHIIYLLRLLLQYTPLDGLNGEPHHPRSEI